MTLHIIERVLLVESDLEIAQQAADALETHGFVVTQAHDIGTAGVAIRRDTPDLIVVASDMAQEPGTAICRRIKGVYPDLPVVMLVPVGSEEARQEAKEAGADACLGKPFQGPQLASLIQQFAHQRTSPAASPAPPERIHFQCHACGKRMRARPSQRGRLMRCPDCGASLQIPMSG